MRSPPGALARLGARRFEPHVLAGYLAPKIVHEIRNDIEDTGLVLATLQASTDFALRTERALERLLRQDG